MSQTPEHSAGFQPTDSLSESAEKGAKDLAQLAELILPREVKIEPSTLAYADAAWADSSLGRLFESRGDGAAGREISLSGRKYLPLKIEPLPPNPHGIYGRRVRGFIPGFNPSAQDGYPSDNHCLGAARLILGSKQFYALEWQYPTKNKWGAYLVDTLGRSMAAAEHEEHQTMTLFDNEFNPYQQPATETNHENPKDDLLILEYFASQLWNSKRGFNQYQEIQSGDHMRGLKFRLPIFHKSSQRPAAG